MKTNQLLRLHEKSIAILEMIRLVNCRIEENRIDLYTWDRVSWDSPVRIMYTREYLVNKRLKNMALLSRLKSYYSNTQLKLITSLNQSLIA